jgi:glycosyltransferase involved in cell wall biosynthesis
LTRVGFWYDMGIVYSGGLNYYRNLLYAISQLQQNDVEAIVFFGTDVDVAIIADFSKYATVVQTRVLERKTLPWFVHRVLYRAFGMQTLVNRVLKKHSIDIVSHASMVTGANRPYKLVTWIADFQYLHLPDLFPGLDVAKKSAEINRLVGESDMVVVSSQDALKDLRAIVTPANAAKARVLEFVSQPARALGADVGSDTLETKYGFTGRYFFLPNQFWRHKNHVVVFEAIAALKRQGFDVLVLCTGWLRDPRFSKSEYVDNLQKILTDNQLEGNIRLLGSIDYSDVLALSRHAIAVLNPSLFEGWSSSVEEAKSIGKPVILSNLGVHIEQNPPGSRYFAPDDVNGLAAILREAWESWPDEIDAATEATAHAGLQARTKLFGEKYLSIIEEMTHGA